MTHVMVDMSVDEHSLPKFANGLCKDLTPAWTSIPSNSLLMTHESAEISVEEQPLPKLADEACEG